MEDPYDPKRFLGIPRTVRFQEKQPATVNKNVVTRSALVESDSESEQPKGDSEPEYPKGKPKSSGSTNVRRRPASTRPWSTYVLVAALLSWCILLVSILDAKGLVWHPRAFGDALHIPSIFTKHQHSVPTVPPQLSAYIGKAVASAVASAIKDPVGRRDFALAADGARIVSKLTSGFDTDSTNTTRRPPSNILDEDLRSGACWEFLGSHAQVGIKLREYMFPTHITIDHVPHDLAFDIRQAPRQIIVWGAIDGEENQERLAHNVESIRSSPLGLLHGGPEVKAGGHFLPLVALEYDIASPPHIQTFPIDIAIVSSRISFGAVVIEVLSNWGASSTRVYRVRIHGEESLAI